MPERRIPAVDGAPMVRLAGRFRNCFFHNAKATLAQGSGPYFYLPKMESHLRARLDDVFVLAQELLGLPERKRSRATVLIETLPAAFENGRDHLRTARPHGRPRRPAERQYIFSYIKRLRRHPEALTPRPGGDGHGRGLPRRLFAEADPDLPPPRRLRHGRRSRAQIPVRGDPRRQRGGVRRVRADKEREASNGHDGTWVAHPDLVPVAMAGVRPRDAGATTKLGQAARGCQPSPASRC